eukprot:scaffold89793_cov63-Phaeocystis_antarctica.AAC.2
MSGLQVRRDRQPPIRGPTIGDVLCVVCRRPPSVIRLSRRKREKMQLRNIQLKPHLYLSKAALPHVGVLFILARRSQNGATRRQRRSA